MGPDPPVLAGRHLVGVAPIGKLVAGNSKDPHVKRPILPAVAIDALPRAIEDPRGDLVGNVGNADFREDKVVDGSLIGLVKLRESPAVSLCHAALELFKLSQVHYPT